MNNKEPVLVSFVAYAIMLMAPFPSAYFVAESAEKHFRSPLPVAIVIAIVVEGLGFICAHVALKYWEWNKHTRIKKIERSWIEFILAILMYFTYFAATIGLLAVLDVLPGLEAWSKIMFPILSAVGVINLALLLQLKSLKDRANGASKVSNVSKFSEKLDSLLTLYKLTPELTPTEAAKRMNCSRQTIYNYLGVLETQGRISRNGEGVRVL